MPKEYFDDSTDKSVFIVGEDLEGASYGEYYDQQEAKRTMPMSVKDRRDWGSLFRLFDTMNPYIRNLDALMAMEPRPAFLDETWRFESKNVFKVWPSYSAMRAEYQKAGQLLIEEYDKTIEAGTPEGPDTTISGLGGVFLATLLIASAVITIVAVSGAVYQVYKAKESEMEAEGKKHLVELQKNGGDVAAAVGVNWPFAVSKLADMVKYGLIAAALIFTVQYLQKGDD